MRNFPLCKNKRISLSAPSQNVTQFVFCSTHTFSTRSFALIRQRKRLSPILIICSYIAARSNIITNAGARGFHTYVGTFALPSLIFLSLSGINLETVNWKFLLAILYSKAIVFFAVMLTSLLVVRPLNFGKCGILSIFCTQSNDFAIG